MLLTELQNEFLESSETDDKPEPIKLPDWSENAVADDHIWTPTDKYGDCCVEGNECKVNT